MKWRFVLTLCSALMLSSSAFGEPWTFFDNDNAPGGDAVVVDGSLHLSGRGIELWGAQNEFVAYRHVPLAGDFDITTRIASMDSTHEWAKVGIMVANDLVDLAGGGYALAGLTPEYGAIVDSDSDGDGALDWHRHTGVLSDQTNLQLRVQKSGTQLTMSYMMEGQQQWTVYAGAVIPAGVADTQDVCLFVFSHDSSATNTAVFDQFTLNGTVVPFTAQPEPTATWRFLDADNGDGSSYSVDSAVLTLNGRGEELWDSQTEFVALQQNGLAGNFDVAVKVSFLQAPHEWSKAGIMIANDLTDFSKGGYNLLALTPQHGVIMDWDNDGDGTIDWHRSCGCSYPLENVWLRVVRQDNTVSTYYRQQGDVVWNVLQSDRVISSLDSTVDLGMIVFSHDQGQTATAEFEQCSIDGQPDGFVVRDQVLLLVPSDIYPALQPSLDTYISDVESRFPVSLSCITGAWSSPQQLRDELVSQYETNAIRGAILVGSLPLLNWEYLGELYSLTYYYEDLDGTFSDTDGDGFYDYHEWGQNEATDIWVSLIRGTSNTTQELVDFFTKTHDYYTGQFQIQPEALVAAVAEHNYGGYIPAEYLPNLEPIYDTNITVLGGVDEYGNCIPVTRSEYLDTYRAKAYELLEVHTHACSEHQKFDDANVYAADVMSYSQVGGLMTFIFGCHAADLYHSPANNIALAYIQGNTAGQAVVACSRSLGIEDHEDVIFPLLGDGALLGDAYYAWASSRSSTAFIADRFAMDNPNLNEFMWGFTLMGNPFLKVSR